MQIPHNKESKDGFKLDSVESSFHKYWKVVRPEPEESGNDKGVTDRYPGLVKEDPVQFYFYMSSTLPSIGPGVKWPLRWYIN